MADEFKAILTQEELDAVIGERLKRDRETQEKKYKGYTSPEDLAKLKSEHEESIQKMKDAAAASKEEMSKKDEELKAAQAYKIELEKTKIALEAGLPLRYATRLMGSNPDEWKADAEAMAKDFVKPATVVPPVGKNDSAPSSSDVDATINAALGKMAKEAIENG